MDPVLAQVPEGASADVRPTYWVTILRGSVDAESFDREETFVVADAVDVLEVVAWVRERLTPGTLLAEVSAVAAEDAWGVSQRRVRVWSWMPPSRWAQTVGRDFTY